jgi:hypothetical protein
MGAKHRVIRREIDGAYVRGGDIAGAPSRQRGQDRGASGREIDGRDAGTEDVIAGDRLHPDES